MIFSNLFSRYNSRYSNKQKGITLVALVVTIVVLLILSGITITALFGDNGIISQAQKAKDATENDEKNTQQGLANLADALGNATDSSGLMTQIKSGSYVTGTDAILTDRNNKTIIIPVGFKIAEDSSTEIDKGVVIEDKTGNQFVWVPVPDDIKYPMFDNNKGLLYSINSSDSFDSLISMGSGLEREPNVIAGNDGTSSDAVSTNLEQAGLPANSTTNDFRKQLQNEFNSMVESVKLYKGFYIGRYESSNLSSSDNSAIPKVVKGVNPSARVNWYYMYKELQNIENKNKEDGYVNENIKTSMIWGCQWDRTLIWLVESGAKEFADLKDSTSWGNYDDATFEYTKLDGSTKATKAIGTFPKIPTGSTEYTKANNIYDLAGNFRECTLECFGDWFRVCRRRLFCQFRFYPSCFRA